MFLESVYCQYVELKTITIYADDYLILAV